MSKYTFCDKYTPMFSHRPFSTFRPSCRTSLSISFPSQCLVNSKKTTLHSRPLFRVSESSKWVSLFVMDHEPTRWFDEKDGEHGPMADGGSMVYLRDRCVSRPLNTGQDWIDLFQVWDVDDCRRRSKRTIRVRCLQTALELNTSEETFVTPKPLSFYLFP